MRVSRIEWSPGAAGPLAGVQSWRDLALCLEVDPELFFPAPGENPHPARRVCAQCPVSAQCLDYAISTGQRFGVWGGLTPEERREARQEAA
jgi:WhiB family transcriptional regulator, redox-sensing transcriptional regulator